MHRSRPFAIAIALLAFIRPLTAQAPGTASLLEREVGRALGRLGATAEFNEWAKKAGSPLAVMRMGTKLSRYGIARLDSATLRVRAEVLQKIFARADVATCAAWTRGALDATRAAALFNTLDSVTISRWGDVSARAIVAQMRATTAVAPPTNAEGVQAFNSVKPVMSAKDRARYEDVLPRLSSASDADMCWFSRVVYASALKLPQAQRAATLAMFARIEAQ